jgi:hypothetical protein
MTSDDDLLLSRLREIFGRADPAPPAVLSAARDCLGWRDLDAALARLTADSLLSAAGVRGGSARLLSYEAGEFMIEIQASEVSGRLRILGQVVPPQPVRVRVDQPTGSIEVTADALGRFSIGDLAPGITRFACIPLSPEEPPVCTEWTVL